MIEAPQIVSIGAPPYRLPVPVVWVIPRTEIIARANRPEESRPELGQRCLLDMILVLILPIGIEGDLVLTQLLILTKKFPLNQVLDIAISQ